MSDEPAKLQGAHTVTSYTSIDDVGSINTTFPQCQDRSVMARPGGKVITWQPGHPAKEATGDDKLLRALQWAMGMGERP